MNILCVCGLGQGTSLILRIHVEAALKEMGVKAEVDHADVSSAGSAAADLILTSRELADSLRADGKEKANIVVVNNYFDKQEIRAALESALNRLSAEEG